MLIIQKIQPIKAQYLNFIELSESTSPRYHVLVPIELGMNAEFANSYHLKGDHNRQHAGGGYKPVSYLQHGVMSGERRLQHGLDRNTRSVSFGALGAPDNFWFILELTKVNTTMNALSACASTAIASPHPLHYIENPHGIIAYQDGLPIAWIIAGYHQGQINNKPHTCRFVDAAYRRATYHGVNLETFESDSVAAAKQTLEHLFGGAA
ncbi:hypothetical protein [Thiofilum flexile]|uniref:hypothetical protein n=1 Tax=Thiofilum flexile TaxID=125627 RepID=UPI000377A8A2|nr:hypothetical protein [Thiofilum flexile]